MSLLIFYRRWGESIIPVPYFPQTHPLSAKGNIRTLKAKRLTTSSMNKSRTLAQAQPQLQTMEGVKEMLFREVITSSKIEGIKNAKAVLTKLYKAESSLNQRIPKKRSHKLPV